MMNTKINNSKFIMSTMVCLVAMGVSCENDLPEDSIVDDAFINAVTDSDSLVASTALSDRKTFDWNFESDLESVRSGDCGSCNFSDKTLVTPSEELITDERTVTEFNQLNVAACGIDVFVTQGSAQSVVVEAPDNVLPFILTEIVAGELIVKIDENICLKASDVIEITNQGTPIVQVSGSNNVSVKVFITVTDLEQLGLSKASNVFIEDGFTTDQMDIFVSTGGDLLINDLVANNLRMRASTSSDVILSGEVGDVAAELSEITQLFASNLVVNGDTFLKMFSDSEAILSGSSDYFDADVSTFSDLKAFDFISNEVFLNVSLFSDAEVSANDFLGLDVDQFSDVAYKGNPQISRADANTGTVTDAN